MSNIFFLFFQLLSQLEIQPVFSAAKHREWQSFLFLLLDAEDIIDITGGALWRRRKFAISV